jgi:acyl homoserine lactone synthase
MLADTFPMLLNEYPAPRDERIIESSRFCVDTSLVAEPAENGLSRVTLVLFAAMVEAARAGGADQIVTVTDTRMERILRRAEWPLRRIAAPQSVGSTMAVAGFLEASEQALRTIYRRANVSGKVLLDSDPASVAA